jgi:two-component sensor histidine kinase
MQIISSLLNLQTQYLDDNKVAVDVLKEGQNRVKSMAMIHKKLHKPRTSPTLNLMITLKV